MSIKSAFLKIRVRPETRADLKRLAEARDVPAAVIVREALRDFVAREQESKAVFARRDVEPEG